MKRIFAISMCLLFVFATSGNSRGLIFKNLAKTYHSINVDAKTQLPSAEELNEQVNEHKVPIQYVTAPTPFIEVNDLNHLLACYNRKGSPHFLDILVPPPEVN